MGNNKGFTLIELITVMAILTILMGIAVPRIHHIRENAALNVDVNNGRLVKNSMDIFYNTHGHWPKSLNDIFGHGKYLSTVPVVQSRKGKLIIGKDGRVQVLRRNEVHWCSDGTTKPIVSGDRLK